MLWPQLLLSDGLRLLKERLGEIVGGVFPQVDAYSFQQLRGLWQAEAMLLDQRLAGLRLREKTQALGPGLDLSFGIGRKKRMNRTDHAPGPLALLLDIHLIQ